MKKLVKSVALVLVVISAFGLLTACGSGSGSSAETADFDVSALSDELLSSSAFSDKLSSVAEDTALMLYSLTSDQVAECSVCCSTGATAEEIAVFKASSEDSAKQIESAMKTRVENQNQSFENYVPEEIPKLEKAIIVRNGLYVVYVVANDESAAQMIVDKYM